MNQEELSMLYPTFIPIESCGQVLPVIRLPKNFIELVPRFYQEGRKQEIEEYVPALIKLLKLTPMGKNLNFKNSLRMNWNENRGLTSISFGYSGLDLDEQHEYPRFIGHNLGTLESFVSGVIAMQYISELIKSGI